jgi:hypothetical protein
MQQKGLRVVIQRQKDLVILIPHFKQVLSNQDPQLQIQS